MSIFKQRIGFPVIILLMMPVLIEGQAADTTDFVSNEVYLYDFYPEEYHHSPHKATLYSAVLPGLGQIYNDKYWKVPLLYAGIGGVVYGISFNTTYYNRYRSAYRDFLIRDPGNTSYERFIPPTLTIDDVHGRYAEWFQRALQNKRRRYKRDRDLSYIGLAAIYLANIIDAAVDAHFYDFDISDDLSFSLEPVLLQPYPESNAIPALQLQIRF
ncbi:DUF5683 domain-containing protein [Alkalitalea saponilacus]|uniref:DUF5683 domain-containing protein n=1 Tax=Alkalitalea saponilacus TaxID=889453 RepID=A0A1T5A346_9BACT|nr:DUF5683 domain-containing protein [Alkalitalea saponilacus]SKB29412.1 hypothetical protein SAMN03080601_00062 [Alkalitalea saponilacus]